MLVGYIYVTVTASSSLSYVRPFGKSTLCTAERYMLDFSPLANASEFRASLRTRALRPFNFRVAAFGGSRDPFGFFPSCADVPKLAAAAGGDEVMAAAESSGRSVAEPANARKVPLLLRERWPYCAVDASEGLRVVGGASPTTLGEPVGGTVVVGTAEDQERCKAPELWGGGVGDVGGGRGHGPNGAGGRGSAGGGWRHPVSTALAIGVATNQAQLAEKERERCHLLCLFVFTSSVVAGVFLLSRGGEFEPHGVIG